MKVRGSVTINPELIPNYAMARIARYLKPRIERFYEDPDNVRAFEIWLEGYRTGKKAAEGGEEGTV